MNVSEMQVKVSKMSTSRMVQTMARTTGLNASEFENIDRENLKYIVFGWLIGDLTLEAVQERIAPFAPAPQPLESHLTNDLAVLKADAHKFAAKHFTAQFPIKHLGNGSFRFEGSYVNFKMASDGLEYVCYRLEPFLSRPEAFDALNSHEWDRLANLINKARELQLTGNSHMARRESFVVVVSNGSLSSMMTTYKVFSNEEVLNAIEEAGLANLITRGYVNRHLMGVYIHSNYQGQAPIDVLFGIKVVNGETGHAQLGYNAFFHIDDYEYVFPARAITRHQGHMNEVVANLKTIFDEMLGVEIFETLQQTLTVKEAMDAVKEVLTDRQFDKLEEKLTYGGKAFTIVAQLSALRDERGFKMSATKAIDAIMKIAYKKVTNS